MEEIDYLNMSEKKLQDYQKNYCEANKSRKSLFNKEKHAQLYP